MKNLMKSASRKIISLVLCAVLVFASLAFIPANNGKASIITDVISGGTGVNLDGFYGVGADWTIGKGIDNTFKIGSGLVKTFVPKWKMILVSNGPNGGSRVYIPNVATKMIIDPKYREWRRSLANFGSKVGKINVIYGIIDNGYTIITPPKEPDWVKDMQKQNLKYEGFTTADHVVQKGLWVIDAGASAYGIYMVGGAIIGGAPLLAAGALLGTGYAATKLGISIVRAGFDNQTFQENIWRPSKQYVTDVRDFVKDLGSLPKDMRSAGSWFGKTGQWKEGIDIVQEDLGFDLYPGLRREIPDPGTGIGVYKPNIYIYSDKPIHMNVTLNHPDYIDRAIPEYDVLTGWDVDVEPGSRITVADASASDGSSVTGGTGTTGSIHDSYGYLFYEATVPDEGFQMDKGWRVKGKNLEKDLGAILNKYGFNEQEQHDFLEFWRVKLDNHLDYIAYPQNTGIVNKVMPVNIFPVPDKVYRVWFYFKPHYDNIMINQPTGIEAIQREDYTVVEWGGLIGKK